MQRWKNVTLILQYRFLIFRGGHNITILGRNFNSIFISPDDDILLVKLVTDDQVVHTKKGVSCWIKGFNLSDWCFMSIYLHKIVFSEMKCQYTVDWIFLNSSPLIFNHLISNLYLYYCEGNIGRWLPHHFLYSATTDRVTIKGNVNVELITLVLMIQKIIYTHHRCVLLRMMKRWYVKCPTSQSTLRQYKQTSAFC